MMMMIMGNNNEQGEQFPRTLRLSVGGKAANSDSVGEYILNGVLNIVESTFESPAIELLYRMVEVLL